MPKTKTIQFEESDVKLIETMQQDYVKLQSAIGTSLFKKTSSIPTT